MSGPWEKYKTQPSSSSGPWTKFAPRNNETPDQGGVSKTESALRGLSQGATLGLGDEGSGAAEATLGALDSFLTGSNNFGDQGHFAGLQNIIDNYDRGRDTVREQNSAAQAANPKTYMASEVAGSLPLTIATAGGGEAAEGASLGSRIAAGAMNAGKQGAIYGGVGGFGHSDADLTDPSLSNYGQAALDTAKGMGTGALIGGSIGGMAPIASDAFGSLQNGLQGFANNRIVDALGGTKGQIQKLTDKGFRQKLGQFLNDEGNIGPFTGRQAISENLDNVADQYGRKIGAIVKTADETNAGQLASQPPPEVWPSRSQANSPYVAPPEAEALISKTAPMKLSDNFIDPSEVAQRAQDAIIKPLRSGGTSAENSAADAIEGEIQNMLKANNGGPVPYSKVQNMIKVLRDSNGVYKRTGETAKLGAYEDYYNLLRDMQQEGLGAIDANQGSNLGPEFQNARTKYAQASNAQDLVSGKLAREAANRAVTPSDLVTGSAGLIHGGPAKAIIVGGTNHLLGQYGNQIAASAGRNLASGAGALSSAAEGVPQYLLPIYDLLAQKLNSNQGEKK